jgi:hypothetical protein
LHRDWNVHTEREGAERKTSAWSSFVPAGLSKVCLVKE